MFGKSTKCSKKVGKSEDSQGEDLNEHNTKKQKMESMAMKEETTDEIYCEDKVELLGKNIILTQINYISMNS